MQIKPRATGIIINQTSFNCKIIFYVPKVLSQIMINDLHKFPISKVINGNNSTFWCLDSRLGLNLSGPHELVISISFKSCILNILCVALLMSSTKQELFVLATGVTECDTNLISQTTLRIMIWFGIIVLKEGC